MRTLQFGGKQVSALALGSSDFGGTIVESQAAEFMDAYVELGGSYIDTARVYGDFAAGKLGEAEKVIGRWMARRHNRDRLFLSTKGGHPCLDTMTVSRLSRDEIRDDMRGSLEDLQTDCVDIYWLHRDDESRPVGDIMETLQGLIEDGCTRMVGVSNWRAPRILEANAYAARHGLTPLAGDQPHFSLARQVVVEDPTLVQMDAELYRMHVQTNLPCTPFSSQAKGFFIKYDTLGEAGLPDKARRRFLCPENVSIYHRLCVLREQTGLSIGALSLAWLTSQPFPVIPLVGVSRMEHIDALREAGDAVITAEQRDFLRTL